MFSCFSVQVIGSSMYSPSGYWNFKLLQDSKTFPEAVLGTLPILLSHGHPGFQIPRECLQVGIGGGRSKLQEAVRLIAGFCEICRSQPSIRYSELRLQTPIPMEEKSWREFWIEHLPEALQRPLVISPLDLKVAFGDPADGFRLTSEMSRFAIHNSVAELPCPFIIQNERAQPCFPKNKQPGRVPVFLGSRFSLANNLH